MGILADLSTDRLLDVLATLGWLPEPYQIAPPGDWTYWLLVAGRGAGKTAAGAWYVDQHARSRACLRGAAPHRIAIAAPTLGDGRLTCVMGDSGLLWHNHSIRLHHESELAWPNGSIGRIFGAYTPEDVERWRGPQHCLVWLDELSVWRQLDECWENMRLGLRLGRHPRAIITTTPKPRKLLKKLMERRDAVVTHATTRDNPHLDIAVRDDLYDLFRGTRLERQELGGEFVDEIEGALWTRAMLEHLRGKPPAQMSRIVVAVDPAVTSGLLSDETGIVVAGIGGGYGWVLQDRSLRASPAMWASAAVEAYHSWQADRIIAESNNGGDMVRDTILGVDSTVPVKLVTASQGKRTRAEPIAARYEQGKILHAEGADLTALEGQMCTWLPSSVESPDRMDAMVWAMSELMLGSGWSSVTGSASAIA